MTIDTEATEVETVNKTPQIVKVKAFTPEFVTALTNYLVSRPFSEVSNFVGVLQNSPEIDVTITNAPQSN